MTVLDAQTGQPPVTATLVVTDGAFRAEGTALGTPGTLRLVAAEERPGTYTVTVSSAGYRDWTATDVRAVRSGKCSYLRTASLTARLLRLGSVGGA